MKRDLSSARYDTLLLLSGSYSPVHQAYVVLTSIARTGRLIEARRLRSAPSPLLGAGAMQGTVDEPGHLKARFAGRTPGEASATGSAFATRSRGFAGWGSRQSPSFGQKRSKTVD